MHYLTKSRYISGLQCLRKLWLVVHEPPEWSAPESGSLQDVGIKVGECARTLFPGGVLVTEKPWEHDQAVQTTASLMADKSVPAIFEAAFEHDSVRVRVDVLERLPRGSWGLREVKSSGTCKPHYLDDVAVQMHVLKGAGLRLGSVQVIHVNKEYVRGKRGIAWKKLFVRAEVKPEARARLKGMAERLAQQMTCLRKRKKPAIDPGDHCDFPNSCDYWDQCTADKPDDWVFYLPRLSQTRLDKLKAVNIQSISRIPKSFSLTGPQNIVRDTLVSGRPFVSRQLGVMLKPFSLPALYMDFEACGPAIPLYAGTRPFERVPFQWSLHRQDAGGAPTHQEFLADPATDPRREFAETLIQAAAKGKEPIIVFSPYEKTCLKMLATEFADLRRPIERILSRLADLAPVVSRGVYFSDFKFSYSLKTVGAALCPGFGYDDLDLVADGLAAANAFVTMAVGAVDRRATDKLRQALLTYCKRDTLALVNVHLALLKLVAANAATGAEQ